MLSICLAVMLFVADVIFAIWIIKEERKIRKEYGKCHKLEAKRIKDIPKCLRKLNKSLASKTIFHLCYALKLTQPDLIRFGFFPCGLSIAGEYRVKQNQIILSFHGLRKFDIATIVHEVAHHFSVSYHYNFKHDDQFLKDENMVFDELKELIRLKIVGN